MNMNQIYNLEELEKYYLQCQQDQNQNTFELDVLYLKRVMKLILQQQESTTTSKKSIIQNYLLQFPHITSSQLVKSDIPFSIRQQISSLIILATTNLMIIKLQMKLFHL